MDSQPKGGDKDTTGEKCALRTKLLLVAAPLIALLSERATKQGAEAFRSGASRNIPGHYGIYSGDWLNGYEEAAFAGIACCCCVPHQVNQASLSSIE